MSTTKRSIVTLPVALVIGVTGCSTFNPTPPYGGNPPQSTYPGVHGVQYGTVDRIEVIERNAGSNIAGTIIGGVIGGLIGTQIGGGSGRTAATIAGAVGGAAAGNAIEGRRRAAHETFRITVRLDNGALHTVTQDNITDLRTGDRVRVEGNAITRL